MRGPSDYEAITRRNEVRLGTDRASRMSQVSMYADTAHFIYELLQNADDAGATEITFSVTDDALFIEHNGRAFTEADVENISYFGKGKTDRTKIGHFGLGFKSVFAYTASPHIHSGPESFEIFDLYSLRSTPSPDDLPDDRTRFVLPFDHEIARPTYIEKQDLKTAAEARTEIAAKLAHLEAETLLFTESLGEIRWSAPDAGGSYRRETERADSFVREVIVADEDDDRLPYLIFDRTVEWPDDVDATPQRRRPVEIAFRLSGRHDGEGKIIPLQTPLFVFFATAMSAGVGFILQGPYRTTPARDNVPRDDPFNRQLVSVSADLLVDALRWLRDRQLLTLDALTTLPLHPTAGFEPLHAVVREALLNEPLLPAADGGYVAASHAKLARGVELVSLFAPEQLAALFETPGLRWIDGALTESGQYEKLHTFLAGKKALYSWEPQSPALVRDINIEADDIARRVNAPFMAAQSDEWIVRLYAYLRDRRSSEFLRRPIIRLASGTHVRPFSDDRTPNAFLPVESTEEMGCELPFVHAPLLVDTESRSFLEDVLHLTTPDICDVVMKNVLPLFPPAAKLTIEAWRQHFPKIRAALRASGSAKHAELQRLLRTRTFLLAEKLGSPDVRFFEAPSAVYIPNDVTRTYFASGAAFLLASSEYEDGDVPLLRELGVRDEPRVTFREPDQNGNVIIHADHSNHERGLSGFDPYWSIDGLEEAIRSGSATVARLLWRYLLPLSDFELMRGRVERSRRADYRPARTEQVESDSGRLLREHAWLPDADGDLHRPADIGLDDLPAGFEKATERARKLAQQLGMALPHQDQVLDALVAGDTEKRRVLDRLFTADASTWKKIERILASEPASSITPAGTFRDAIRSMGRRQREGPAPQVDGSGEIRNPNRYRVNVEAEVEDAIDGAKASPAKVRMQIVRAAPSNADARAFLYAQYEGRCQVTGATFRKADGTNYFEAVSLVSRLTAEHLNHPGNMLCLSAETAAKVTYGAFEWIDDIEVKIDGFRTAVEGASITDRQIRIRVVGEEHVVTWTEQHFVRLIALWKLG